MKKILYLMISSSAFFAISVSFLLLSYIGIDNLPPSTRFQENYDAFAEASRMELINKSNMWTYIGLFFLALFVLTTVINVLKIRKLKE